MKKLFLVLAVLFGLTAGTLPTAGLATVQVEDTVIEEALEANDPEWLIRNYLIPYLEENPQAALLFAAEMNLSNGSPKSRDFGERGMFTKLVDARYVMDHYDELEPMKDDILAEAERLLVGPWKNGGRTTFSFTSRSNMRELCYETGQWTEGVTTPIILVVHYTEYTNKKKVLYLSCDFNHPQEDGSYSIGFNILRKA